MVVWYIVFGVIGGIIGGMGMGGGTLLIPLLVIFGGVEQGLAQGMNLLSFVPMSGVSLAVHAKQGLIKANDVLFLIIPALITSVAGAILANAVKGEILGKFFGVFLLCLGVYFLFITLKNNEKTEKQG